jgi:hypothetical protein
MGESDTATEYKTMRVPEDAWEQAREAKASDETWGEYLLRCADESRVEIPEDELDRRMRNTVRELVVDEALR